MKLTLASFMKKSGPEAGDLRLFLNLRFLGLHSLFVFSDLTPNFPQSHLFLGDSDQMPQSLPTGVNMSCISSHVTWVLLLNMSMWPSRLKYHS